MDLHMPKNNSSTYYGSHTNAGVYLVRQLSSTRTVHSQIQVGSGRAESVVCNTGVFCCIICFHTTDLQSGLDRSHLI